MNLVKFFREAAKRWNDESRCGICWRFGAPLSVNSMNNYIVRSGDECCTHLFLTRYSNQTIDSRNPNTNLINGRTCNHAFDLYCVVQRDSMGTMIDNEIPDYDSLSDDEKAGLWDEVLEKLLGCIGCGMEFDLCEMGYDFNITSWRLEPAIYEQDFNWCGWKISGTFAQPLDYY